MRLLGAALTRAGYGVYGPKFTGHGTIDPQDVLAVTPDQWWRDTQAAIAHMAAKYSRVAVFGLSLGGVFAMKALQELPAVACGGVLSSPIVAGKQNILANFLKYNYYMRRLAELPDNSAQVTPQVQAQLTTIETFSASVAAKLAMVTKPVFIGQAGADKMIDPQRAVKLRQKLINAPVSWHWYAGADHVITVNTAHRQLETDIIEFMKTRDK
jgi:carboxylesterase